MCAYIRSQSWRLEFSQILRLTLLPSRDCNLDKILSWRGVCALRVYGLESQPLTQSMVALQVSFQCSILYVWHLDKYHHIKLAPLHFKGVKLCALTFLVNTCATVQATPLFSHIGPWLTPVGASIHTVGMYSANPILTQSFHPQSFKLAPQGLYLPLLSFLLPVKASGATISFSSLCSLVCSQPCIYTRCVQLFTLGADT